MIIKLKIKRNFAEHETIKFNGKPNESMLIRALGKLDDGEIDAIIVPNHSMPKEYIEHYLLPEFYSVEF